MYKKQCKEGEEWVESYTKDDGTYVHGFCRKITRNEKFLRTNNESHSVHVIGMGNFKSMPVRDLEPGMVIVYNWGGTGVVKSISPNKSGKTMDLVVVENGKDYKVRKGSFTQIVAYKKKE